MNRFIITIATCLLMLVAVPFTGWLAVAEDTPLYTHFTYLFGHDGFLHYTINAWALLVMHNLYRWYRVLAAYAFAVLLSFVMLPAQPMVGASVFTCFFLGFMAPWLWRKERMACLLTVGLMLLTCILPGFAGFQHVAAFSFGVAFSFAEGHIRNIRNYLRK